MTELKIIALCAVATFGFFIGAIALIPHHGQFRRVGAPASARCSFENSQGVRTCIDGTTVYTCVTDWRENIIQCAPAPSVRL